MNQSGIYEIVNTVNGKRYIGQTSNFKKRWKEHRTGMKRGDHGNSYLQRAWNKYGEAAFKFLPILTCQASMLTFYEQQLLDKVKPEYNLAPVAGTVRGIKHSAQARKNMSDAHKGKPGRPMSPETKEKLRLINTGRRLSPEQIEKMRSSRLGVPRSPESIAAQIVGQTGTKRSEAAKANMSKAQAGRKLSPEHCAAISWSLIGQQRALGHIVTAEQRMAHSIRMTGRKLSAEHKEKIRAALKGRPLSVAQSNALACLAEANRGKKRPEVSERMRVANLGRVVSSETRAKMSESQKARRSKEKAGSYGT